LSNSLRIAAALGHLLLWCSMARQSRAKVGLRLQTPLRLRCNHRPLRVEESRPAVLLLARKQGNLQPVLDFKYQDFVELYKLKNELERRDQPPRYSPTANRRPRHRQGRVRPIWNHFQCCFATTVGAESPLRPTGPAPRCRESYKGFRRNILCIRRERGRLCLLVAREG